MVPHHEEAPISLCPQTIDRINVDLTPFKKSHANGCNLFLEKTMWKIAVGFAVFAGLALYVISQGGDNIDMTGEKHGAEAVHVPAPAEATAAPVSAPAPASK